MALLHRANVSPSKLELLAGWLPTQDWASTVELSGGLTRVAACRFDDPAGEVGLETFVVGAADGSGPLLHTPLTYRAAPLEGAEAWLVGTAEHTVLGTRWVYDACGDPVYTAVLAQVILAGGTEAEEFVDVDGTLQPREPLMRVRGTGTGVTAGPLEVTVNRFPGEEKTDALALVGEWAGGPGPVVLATARAR